MSSKQNSFGPFQLAEHISSSPTSEVHLASPKGQPQHSLILKIFNKIDEKEWELCRARIGALKQLAHPRIVVPTEADRFEGSAYLVRHSQPAIDLIGFLHEIRQRRLSLSYEVAITVVTDVLDGLVALHSKDKMAMHHGAVNATHVLIDQRGTALLLGAEKPRGIDRPAAHLDVAGAAALLYEILNASSSKPLPAAEQERQDTMKSRFEPIITSGLGLSGSNNFQDACEFTARMQQEIQELNVQTKRTVLADWVKRFGIAIPHEPLGQEADLNMPLAPVAPLQAEPSQHKSEDESLPAPIDFGSLWSGGENLQPQAPAIPPQESPETNNTVAESKPKRPPGLSANSDASARTELLTASPQEDQLELLDLGEEAYLAFAEKVPTNETALPPATDAAPTLELPAQQAPKPAAIAPDALVSVEARPADALLAAIEELNPSLLQPTETELEEPELSPTEGSIGLFALEDDEAEDEPLELAETDDLLPPMLPDIELSPEVLAPPVLPPPPLPPLPPPPLPPQTEPTPLVEPPPLPTLAEPPPLPKATEPPRLPTPVQPPPLPQAAPLADTEPLLPQVQPPPLPPNVSSRPLQSSQLPPTLQRATGLRTAPPLKKRIGEILIGQGVLQPFLLQQALQQQQQRPGKIGEILVNIKALTEAQLAQGLAAQSGHRFISDQELTTMKVQENLISGLPEAYASAKRVLPIAQDPGTKTITFVVSDPFDTSSITETRVLMAAQQAEILIAGRSVLEETIRRLYAARGTEVVGEGGALVLVCTTNQGLAETLKARLSAEGFSVRHVSDGKAARDTVTSTEIGAMVTELALPKVDGYNLILTTRSREIYQDIPILVFSSRADDYHMSKALELGADDFLPTPLNIDFLVSKLKRSIGRRPTAPATPAPVAAGGVAGSLKEMSLPEIVQTLELGRKTATVDINFSTGINGRIVFVDGQVVAAVLPDEVGETAFYKLAIPADGTFHIHYGKQEGERNINNSTTFLLLEAMRRVDEAR